VEVIVNESGVEIIPNRRQIDNKFPVLGFTVKTGGLPFYEIIVTTEKGLFAPPNATGRSAANFFSSRQTSNQLQRAEAGDTVYMVPASVLNAFAQGSPKPSAIYYALIAYADEQGGGARFAQPPETLASDAPSVELAPSFTGQTLSKVLGINCDSLRRVESVGAGFAAAASYPSAYFSGLSQNEPDEGEAEDGYSLMKALGFSPALEANREDEVYAEDGYEYNQRQTTAAAAENYDDGYSDGYEDGYSTPESYGSAYSEDRFYVKGDGARKRSGRAYLKDDDDDDGSDRVYAKRRRARDDDDDYEDGFEEDHGTVRGGLARMQESVFPAGASEPDELYDEDAQQPYGEDESFSLWNDDYSAPAAAAGYGEPEYECAGASASGLNYRTNGHSRNAYDDFGSAQAADDFEEDYGESYGSFAQRTSRAAETGECSGEIDTKRRIKARKKIVETIARFESGSGASRYKAINADQEFAAWTWHEAYQKYHIGLSYGIVQFTQDGGSLGKLLKMMRGRDKATFDKTFGGASLADDLISVTNAGGAFSKDTKSGRSARVQPVGGTDLWLSPWKERFQAAGDVAAFQAAQNELANDEYLEPILVFCEWLGLDTDRAVAMVYDRAVQMGVGGAKSFVIGAVGPVSTTALRTQALTALGKKDLKEFQSSFGGLTADGKWGPLTHAALVSALRALGTKSPIPIPTRDQMLDSLVRAAAGKDWEHRVKNLRKTTDLDDTRFLF
jgi:hypothetical protein